MRLLNPEESDIGIYATAEGAAERIILWRSDVGLWWAVARTPAPEIGFASIDVAYALDKSERTDAAVIRWADATYHRAKHPEEETAYPLDQL